MNEPPLYQKVKECAPCYEHALMGLVVGCENCQRPKRWRYEPVKPVMTYEVVDDTIRSLVVRRLMMADRLERLPVGRYALFPLEADDE